MLYANSNISKSCRCDSATLLRRSSNEREAKKRISFSDTLAMKRKKKKKNCNETSVNGSETGRGCRESKAAAAASFSLSCENCHCRRLVALEPGLAG